jgi:hypothetical protein
MIRSLAAEFDRHFSTAFTEEPSKRQLLGMRILTRSSDLPNPAPLGLATRILSPFLITIFQTRRAHSILRSDAISPTYSKDSL